MTPEQKLQALFAANNPPAQDYGFEIGVLQRVAKQRAIARFIHLAMMMVVAGGLLLAFLLGLKTDGMASILPLMASVAASGVAGLVVWTVGRAKAR